MMAVEDTADDWGEGTPFLDPEIDEDVPEVFRRAWYQPSTPAGVVGLMTFIIFCMTLSGTICLIPLARLTEDVVCRKHYGSPDPVDEKLCKVDEIQTQLAWLGGLYIVINAVIGLIVSFPWGILSDRIGRKPVFRLSFGSMVIGGTWTSLVLARWDIFPIHLILLSPVSAIFGGGLSVTVAVIHSIIADVTTERSSGFISLSLGAVLGSVAGPALSAKMMEIWNPWVPLFISGLILTPTILISMIFLPETRPRLTGAQASTVPEEPLLAAMQSHLVHARERLVESLTVLRKRPVVLLLVMFFITDPVQMASGHVLTQLLSNRFKWLLADIGYLLSVRGILTVVVLAVIPFVSGLMTSRFRMPVFKKDLILMQASLGCLVVGNLLTGGERPTEVILGQVISTFSAGFSSLAKGLIASHVDKEHTARLFALTGMVETTGSIFGGPFLAWSFGRGVKMGGRWMGLPFFCIAALCALALVAVCFVEKPRMEKHEEESQNRESVELHGSV